MITKTASLIKDRIKAGDNDYQIAASLDLSTAYVKQVRVKLGFAPKPRKRGRKMGPLDESRTELARKMKEDGATYLQIGNKFGVSRARADQILNPDKHRARIYLHKALNDGEIRKPKTCQWCKSDQNIEAHHTDYAKPLAVKWLCRKCHTKATWKKE